MDWLERMLRSLSVEMTWVGKLKPRGQLQMKLIRAPNNTAKYKFVKWLNRTLKGQTNAQA